MTGAHCPCGSGGGSGGGGGRRRGGGGRVAFARSPTAFSAPRSAAPLRAAAPLFVSLFARVTVCFSVCLPPFPTRTEEAEEAEEVAAVESVESVAAVDAVEAALAMPLALRPLRPVAAVVGAKDDAADIAKDAVVSDVVVSMFSEIGTIEGSSAVF